MQEKIIDWYRKNYPTDTEVWFEENITFSELFYMLLNKIEIYDVIECDSLVRERCFEHLSELLNIEYDCIYETWLGGLDRYVDFIVNKHKPSKERLKLLTSFDNEYINGIINKEVDKLKCENANTTNIQQISDNVGMIKWFSDLKERPLNEQVEELIEYGYIK